MPRDDGHERPTTALYLISLIEQEPCVAHNADKGVPCWALENSLGVAVRTSCNIRAIRAGFNAKISKQHDKSTRKFKSYLTRTLKEQ